MHYDYSYIPVPVAIACVPFLKNYPFLPLPLACSFRCRCLYYIPSDYQFQLSFVPAHTPKPILRNLLFWLSKVASSPIPKHSQRSSGRHRKGDEKSLFTFTIFRNVSWLYLFIKKKKRVLHLSEAGETNRRGEERERGATSPLPLLFPDHPYLLSPSPGPVRSDFSNEVK